MKNLIYNDDSGINEYHINTVVKQLSAEGDLRDMEKHTKENRCKKNERQESQLWATKVSFVSACSVIIAIVRDIVEYFGIIFGRKLPYGINIVYVAGCVILLILAINTKMFDKYLHSKSVENYVTYLTLFSVLLFMIENSIPINIMDTGTAIFIVILLSIIVAGAVCLLFIRYKKTEEDISENDNQH